MSDGQARTFYVVTLHGQVGPFDLATLREQLAAGAFGAGSQVRSAFGRPLGTVQEVLAAARRGGSSGGLAQASDPAPPPERVRMPVGLLLVIGGLLALAALLAFRRGGEPPAPVAPAQEPARTAPASVAPSRPRLDPVVPTAPVAQPAAPAPAAVPSPEPSVLAPDDQVWLDDALPVGAVLHESSLPWSFAASTAPSPCSGNLVLSTAGKEGQFAYVGAQPLRIAPGDVLFVHIWIDPHDPPASIMLKWHDGQTWEHRAFWGRAGFSQAKDKKYGNVRMGDLPPAGTWTRLEVPAARVGLEGVAVSGLSLGNARGRVFWDCAGRRPAR